MPPKLLVSLISLLVFVPSAHAMVADAFDANAALSAETYPLGGMVTGLAGYGKILWQDDEAGRTDSANFWKFGYIRPAVEWQTAALTNRVTGLLEVFPVSIFGLSGGGGADFRNYNNFSGIDCSKFMCDEALTFKFAQAQLIAGAGKFVAVVTARYDSYWAESADRPFYDYMSYLTGTNGRDDLRTLTVLGLYRYSETWKMGAIAFYQDMIFSGSNNGEIAAIAQYNAYPWQLAFGVGDYRSDHQPLKPTAFFVLTYTWRKGVGLLR